MKMRDLKAFYKDVKKMTISGMDRKAQRVTKNDTGKLKLPYKMY